MAVDINTTTKDTAKRVPKTAVFNVPVNLPGEQTLVDGEHTIGFIEGNISISRVMLVVDEVYDGTLPTVTVTGTSDGVVDTHLTAAPLGVEVVDASVLSDGLLAPLYKKLKSEFKATLVLDGSTNGNFKIAVEYLQMDTEPGLHTRVEGV